MDVFLEVWFLNLNYCFYWLSIWLFIVDLWSVRFAILLWTRLTLEQIIWKNFKIVFQFAENAVRFPPFYGRHNRHSEQVIW